MWANNNAESQGMFPMWMRKTVGPLFLMTSTPLAAILFVHANDTLGGSLQTLGYELWEHPVQTIKDAFKMPTLPAIQVLLAFAAFELALMRLVPGKTFRGPVTPAGNVPVYTANGFQSFAITMAAFLIGWQAGYLDPVAIYSLYPQMISALCVFSFAFCGLLYVKGLYFPSSSDSGSSGYPVLDFYWGTELYPRILGWDVKMFTNCRFGMMAWGLLPTIFAAAQYEQRGHEVSLAMLTNVVLQLVYVAKFFWWESGYLQSIDIMHDRAGYYICWGCLVWVPSVYVSHSYYLVKQAPDLPAWAALLLLVAGWTAIYINYDADRQRAHVRSANGKVLIWGKPAQVIRASYTTESGEARTSLLLVSGWWGISRHFHYVPEILAAFCWSAPALFTHFMPHFYVVFLTALLTDRAFRDDSRCAAKYGKDYARYKALVPYKIIPGLI